MDAMEYKLTSNNPILVSHAISNLAETVKQKLQRGENEATVVELEYLMSQCESKNQTASMSACQAISLLAESQVIKVGRAITKLTAYLVTATHCVTVALAVCDLLALEQRRSSLTSEYVCPFNLTAPQHPLITVLLMKKDAWREVLSYIGRRMEQRGMESTDHSTILWRSVFLYILCNPELSVSDSCREHAWKLLISANDTVDLQMETLQWLRTRSAKACIDTNSRITELADIAHEYSCKELCSTLIPMVTSLALELSRHGIDPRPNLTTVSRILQYGDRNSDNISICLLAEMMSISPSAHLLDIVIVASTILEKNSCNRIIAYTLVASIVEWLAHPSILSSEALDVAKRMITGILRMPKTKPVKSFECQSEKCQEKLWEFDANIHFYAKLCDCAELWMPEKILPWLERLSRIPAYVIINYSLIIGALFLESRDTPVVEKSCEILTEIGKNGGRVLSTILYKLTKTEETSEARAMLFALPKLTGSKENAPIVMQTLKMLSSAERPLNYLAIELYIRALAAEPRFHRYILAALVDLCSSDPTWRADVTCALAMRRICEKHPEHGAELVPLLSQILTRSSNRRSGAASALVLEAISSLCVAGVTEVSSTWRVLSPIMSKEERPIVLGALCTFFGDIPHIPEYEESDTSDDLVTELLPKLWHYVHNSKDSVVVRAAFRAMAAYKLEAARLAALPEQVRGQECDGLEESYEAKAAKQTTAEVPASWWLDMFESLPTSSLTHAADYLSHHIQEELLSFRSSIYRWPRGEPINFKYLPERSLLRGVGEHIRNYKETQEPHARSILLECLRIFAQKYRKPLPPVKWSIFEKAIGVCPKSWKYGIAMACHQAQISPSAKDFLEAHLISCTKEWRATDPQLRDALELYEKLDDVCRAVASSVLGPYLETTLNCLLEKAPSDRDNAVGTFEKTMACFSKTLNDDLIHNDNRSLLTNTLEKLMDRVDVDSKIFESFIRASTELAAEQVERMTLPSVWLEVTTERLRKAIRIRGELVLRKPTQVPLTWMNEIIKAAASTSAIHPYLFEELHRILEHVRLEKSNAKWTLDLMHWIGTLLVGENQTTSVESVPFLCEILFITVIRLTATDCLLLDASSLVTSSAVRIKLFPQALANIVQIAHWKDIVPQIMEWLNYMRTALIPTTYKIAFHNALVSLKNENHFDVTWAKYLSTRIQ